VIVNTEWIMERIAATKALILQYETAIGALATGKQSYSLDTGQTRIVVTRAQLGSLQLTLQRLETRLDELERQLRGGGQTNYVRPGW